MAEAVLEIVVGNLNTLVEKELGLFLDFDKDLERLASLFTTIKATLADAEEQQFSNRSIKDWLQKLKEASYILDDILDECALRLENQGVANNSSHSPFLCLFILHIMIAVPCALQVHNGSYSYLNRRTEIYFSI